MAPETILVTGGAGFIGSHISLELLTHGHDVIVVDDFSNSCPAVLALVREIAGRSLTSSPVDVRDRLQLSAIFAAHPIEAVIHFPTKKAVACLVSDASRIEREWGWQTSRGLADMCRDAWQFQKRNSAGYVGSPMTTTSSSRGGK